jgi:ATP-dependent protease ClpP protease subunit
MSAIFNDMKDNDFYTDKLAHLYLDGEITSIKIDKLIEDIRNANKAPNTKPILIHISSTGGSLEDGMRLINIYNISKLPIATIVDNYCFSIATLLLINSPEDFKILSIYLVVMI